jgi:hypothetical protein
VIPGWFADPIDEIERELFAPEPDNPIPEAVRHELACFMKAAGACPWYSTGIGGEITSGYGRLDFNGYWEYPL